MRIIYAIQNVGGIDLRKEVGDAVPVIYTLAGLKRAGHEVDLLRLNGRLVHLNQSSITTGRAGKRPFLLLESAIRRLQTSLHLPYFALFDSFRFYEAGKNSFPRYDLCHEHNGLFSVGAARACRHLNIPYILTFSADPLLELRLLGRPLRGLHAQAAAWAARYTYQTAAKIICVSEPAKNHLVNAWDVPPEKIHVMPNGVNIETFGRDYDSAAVRAEFGLSHEPVVMFVGGFQHWHGIERLVESFAQVLARFPGARLLLVGDGPARAAIEQKITALNINHAVQITGMIPHQRIPELLSIADVAAIPYPKLPQELWFSPLKLYEYMAAGCAIVASRAGQIADVIEHEQNGVLVEPGDVNALAEAIADLLTDAEKRARLGQNARAQAVSQHSWARYIERLEAIYRSVL